ncbi:MAG TPA: hypothetical protein VJV79_12210 [Polyangiaceae bacterium]|nr:hypothetical protein [Polyangiaceae bacterium]
MSAVDVGATTRKGWDGRTPSDQIAILESVAKPRTAEAAGASPAYVPYVPRVGDSSAPRDLREAADYYLTSRGQHPNAPNKMLLTSLSCLVSFAGLDQLEALLTQPILYDGAGATRAMNRLAPFFKRETLSRWLTLSLSS